MQRKQKVFFATPAYDGTVHALMVRSLIEEMVYLKGMGIECVWEPYVGCCYLPIARNRLVQKFIDSDCTDLFFIDGDVQWEPGSSWKLLKHDVDFVAGLYPYKTKELGFPCNFNRSRVDPVTKLIEFTGVPTGFLRLTRNVFKQLDANFMDMDVIDERDGHRYRNYFDTQKIGTQWWGEDLHFCNVWRKIGGTIWVEPNITFYHHGFHGFRGNFLEYVDVMGREEPKHGIIQRVVNWLRS